MQSQGTLIFSNGSEVAVTVVDLSESGFRLTSEEILEAGEQVTLRAGRHADVRAEIRWVEGFAAGGVFLSRAPELR